MKELCDDTNSKNPIRILANCKPLLWVSISLTEIRITSSTGGQKGAKPEKYSQIPVIPLAEVARVYGYGAGKYAPGNWTKGYDYSLSLDALQRHVEAFRSGQSMDPESGLHHMAHAIFHCMTLIQFDMTGTGSDDRLFKEGT